MKKGPLKGGGGGEAVMQIWIRDYVEVHPHKKKEVLCFVKKKLGEIGESSDQLPESESDS